MGGVVALKSRGAARFRISVKLYLQRTEEKGMGKRGKVEEDGISMTALHYLHFTRILFESIATRCWESRS